MKALITGRAGSGKSTVCEELLRRNYEAYDADFVPGLCEWQLRKTGEKAEVNAHEFVDLKKYWWSLRDQAFRKFVADHDNFFICIGAAHELEYTDIFDRSFVLNVSPAIHYERLQNRTNNNYGKELAMAQTIVKLQAELVSDAQKQGFVLIDANKPVAQVVDEILANL